ncbi:MAG: S41 family peptidase [Mariniblastus sp.]
MKSFFTLLIFSLGVFACCDGIHAQTTPSGGMMKYPDVSKDKIVFSYANELWVVNRDGGMASPLASPKGSERFPRFSPDGKTIAFSGNYEGGTDLYTIPTGGGMAERKTFHPSSELLCDWMPDGKSLIYSSNGLAGLGRQSQLFTIGVKKTLPDRMPVPYGTNGAVSADKKWLAYTPHSRDSRTWKRYRGGMASDVWLFNLKDKTSKQITDFEGTDSLPMWNKGVVYYLSDAGDEHRLNIWSYTVSSGEREQVTKFDDYDCKWPAIGPGTDGSGEIVLGNGSDLYLVDLKTKKSKKVDVSIPGDRPTLRAQKVDASDFIESGDISPTGKRVTFEARGDIWTLPVKNGAPRRLTKTNGVAERNPIWSPDGQWIAYLSDESGEYEVYVTQSDGRGETMKLTSDGDCYRELQNWSPDSKHITFTDKTGKLFLLTVASKETKLVDTDPTATAITPSWSHNSQWICYANNSNSRAPIGSIFVYDVTNGTKKQLTDDYFNDGSPVFDKKGEYIFFQSNRSFGSPQYEDLGQSFIYANTGVMVAMPLRSDVKHPMLPKVDEETWKDEKEDGDKDDAEKENTEKEEGADKDAKKEDDAEKTDGDDKQKDAEKKDGDKKDGDKKDGAKKNDKKDENSKPFEIEFDGIERRAFQLPVGNGNFSSLAVNDKNQLLYAERPARGSGGEPAIKLLDLSADKKEAKEVAKGARNFGISADGKKMIVLKRGGFFVADAAPGQKLDKSVSTDGMTVMIDRRQEWRQMLREAWRLERDFFYDPTMHGVDWDAVWEQYEKLLDDCVSRADVGFLMGEMISELNVGHAYYRGDDVPSGPQNDIGLLGCRFEIDGKSYKIAELFQGAKWDVDARNPLVSAGVKEGQYLLAINDQPLTTKQNPYELLRGTLGQTVTLTVSDDAKIDDEDKRVSVKTIRSDANLRFRGWIEANRKYVSDKTDGKVGYIYVVNTGVPGQNDLVRQFFAQMGKEALIIDDRWNGGGQIPTRFIELLNRPRTNYWAKRDGMDWSWPPDSHQGPKCMLINGMAGSGGDMFPALFKQSKLGKLIGMRTWGGLVGISGGPSLLDGSAVTMPSFAYYEKDGTWGIEGHGVDPDIKVIDDPAKMADGGDPQLDAAIDQMLKEIKSNPYKAPKRPAYPDRSKFGIEADDQ